MPPITEEGPCDGKHTPIACGEMNVTQNYKERINTKMKDNSLSHTPFLHLTHSSVKSFAVKCPDIAHPDTHQQGAVVGRGGQRSTQTRGWGENRQARGEDPQCTHV